MTEQIQEGNDTNLKKIGDSSEVVNIEERYHSRWKEFNMSHYYWYFERSIVFLFLLGRAFKYRIEDPAYSILLATVRGWEDNQLK